MAPRHTTVNSEDFFDHVDRSVGGNITRHRNGLNDRVQRLQMDIDNPCPWTSLASCFGNRTARNAARRRFLQLVRLCGLSSDNDPLISSPRSRTTRRYGRTGHIELTIPLQLLHAMPILSTSEIQEV